MKVLSIVGARPQFVKLGPLSREIRKSFDEKIIHTGQHFDENMSKLIFDDLNIPKPDYYCDIHGGKHGEQTGRMMVELEKIFLKEKSDFAIVFGDTNSTLAGSLVAAKLGIKSVHVEAGLRSFNRAMPEEINRIVSDHTSDYLFAPTKTAIENLGKEGLSDKAFLVGDIMMDSIEYAKRLILAKNKNSVSKGFYLVTLHRPYNVDNPVKLRMILQKLGKLEHKIIFPMHPRTKNILVSNNIIVNSNIEIIEPVGYLDFIDLQLNSKKIITDSGGIQKEAYMLKVPCLTLRSETEWVETIESGWNRLVDVNNSDFVKTVSNFQPPDKYFELFGKNVADAMVNKMLEII